LIFETAPRYSQIDLYLVLQLITAKNAYKLKGNH